MHYERINDEKIIRFLLIMMLSLALVACGSKNGGETKEPDDNNKDPDEDIVETYDYDLKLLGVDVLEGDIKVAIYVFERYSYLGENRVTLSVLVTSHENKIKVTAITAGGSQALFFKINRFGEEAFLDKFIHLINRY